MIIWWTLERLAVGVVVSLVWSSLSISDLDFTSQGVAYFWLFAKFSAPPIPRKGSGCTSTNTKRCWFSVWLRNWFVLLGTARKTLGAYFHLIINKLTMMHFYWKRGLTFLVSRSPVFGSILEDFLSSTISNIMEEAMKGEVLLNVRPRVVALPPSSHSSVAGSR